MVKYSGKIFICPCYIGLGVRKLEVFFESCAAAIENAVRTKTFGCFYHDADGIATDIHVHECCEVLLCFSGGKTFFIDDRVFDVGDGTLFLLNPFEAHKIMADDRDFKRFVMQVHPAFLYGHSTESDLSYAFFTRGSGISQKLTLSARELEYVSELIDALQTDSGYGDDVIKNARALELIVFLNRIFREKNLRHDNTVCYGNKTVETALRYINENFAGQLSLEIVAKHSYVSVNELCRLFKRHLGTTVTKYIQSKRIAEAKKRLSAGCSVGETARLCGFCDYANFIRSFKKIVGLPPGRYAAHIAKENNLKQ